MAKERKPQRDRSLGDELWDLDGQRWSVRSGSPARHHCESILADGGLVVHEPGGPLQWLDGVDARPWWEFHLPWVHFTEDLDRPVAAKGLLWMEKIFEAGKRQLLMMESGC